MKKFTVIMLLAFFSIILVACNDNTDITDTEDNTGEIGERDTPVLTNPDEIFYSTDDYDVTYNDLFDSIKINDGLNRLLEMVDQDLLSDFYPEITTEEINLKIDKLTYNTDDPEEIAEISEEDRLEMEMNFLETMYLMGYPEERIEDYVKLVLAREHYVIDLMTSPETVDEVWNIKPESIAKNYYATYNNDIQSLKIKFNSEVEANNFLRENNLVSKNGKLLLYTGTTPIEEVPSFALDDTNTRELAETELFQYFIMMYNFVYGDYRTEIDINATAEELIAMEDLTINYDDIKAFNSSLADFIFNSLGDYETYSSGDIEKAYYTYQPEKFYSNKDTAYYMILNLTDREKPDVNDFEGTEAELVAIIGQEDYDEVKQKIIDFNLSNQSFISSRLTDLRRENGFFVYDYFMEIDYESVDIKYDSPELGSLNLIASYGNKDITVDEFFEYSMNMNAAMYLVHASQNKALIAAHYADVYCKDMDVCEYNLELNESVKMLEHLNAYDSMQAQFEASQYADFYTFEEYLYLAYGARSKTDMLEKFYVKQALQPLYIFDLIQTNDYAILEDLMPMIQPYYDKYFSLDATHLLIYVDRDENGSPDNYEEFYEGLEDTTEFDSKLAGLELAIRNYLVDEENSFTTLITEYKAATRTDETWGEFKRYGFFLMTENLSSSSSLSFTNTNNRFEDSFVERLISLYQEYKDPLNIDEEYLLDDELLETSYGMHLIRVEQGSAFDYPSAMYEMAYDEENQPKFTVGVENEGDQISLSQFRLYMMYRFSIITINTISTEVLYGFARPEMPISVIDALKEFGLKFNDALYVVGYLNMGVITELNQGELVNAYPSYFSGDALSLAASLARINEIYERQIFLELDIR
jgi:hypothetical protein